MSGIFDWFSSSSSGSSKPEGSSSTSLIMPPADSLRNEPTPPAPAERINLTIPHNLLVLPASAAFVGLVIGMSRGGSRARLRFLAENAHRPPTTIQGWYFYTKTRNYRVFFSAAKMGAKYALGLGGATAGFVILDEGTGWAREQITNTHISRNANTPDQTANSSSWKGKGRAVDPSVIDKRIVGGREGWRSGPVHWEDGAVAGMLMGAGVGLIYTLPRPLFIRALIMGTILGGATSGLQTAQDYVGRLRAAQDAEPRLPTALPPPDVTAAGTRVEGVMVDRKVEKGETAGGVPVDETPAVAEGAGGEGSWYSWIPGLGK